MIRVLLVEPMNLLRGALAATLSQEDDLEVVASLGRLDEAVDMARAVPPDVAVVSAELLGGEGAGHFARLVERTACATLVLACSAEVGRLQCVRKLAFGGVIGTSATPAELVRGIRRSARGERVIDADLAVAMVAAPRSPLSQREADVLNVAASGVPNAEIAERLHLTAGTVRNYLSVILRKTGARNRLEAVRVAEGAGWIQ